jgi:small neutral amino acid transporter SnatA (MarC family)
MVGTDSMINAFTTLLVTVDPPGLAPLFLGLTVGMNPGERRQVAVRGSLIAFAVLAVFACSAPASSARRHLRAPSASPAGCCCSPFPSR